MARATTTGTTSCRRQRTATTSTTPRTTTAVATRIIDVICSGRRHVGRAIRVATSGRLAVVSPSVCYGTAPRETLGWPE
jgi:hypothetical protein